MKLLKQLSEAFGGSGYEDEVAAIVEAELAPLCDRVWIDTLGNVIGLKRARAGRGGRAAKVKAKAAKGARPAGGRKRIMLAAHMDEIGFVVSHIDDKGFLRVQPAGGFDPRTMIAQRVCVLGKGRTRTTGLLNVAGKPIHVQSPEERRKDLEVANFFVDVGLPAAEVRKRIGIGDRVIWERGFVKMGDCVTGKALDNRAGVYVMIEALRKIARSPYDIYAVGTVQEEVGLRGASTSAYEIEPHVAIALDVTLAVDIPDGEEHQRVTELGKGVALKIMDSASISDAKLVAEFQELADRKGIPYQFEILPRGGTDAGRMQTTRGGARTITLSVPLRYVHSVNECAHARDLQAAINLLAAYLAGD
ncbi:MAG: M42 family metallopeptidase [Candidatus Eisenbacteria bacterium]|nr:M42 family metallopeptidase [Candidatus Eisenbacteria bacterium]